MGTVNDKIKNVIRNWLEITTKCGRYNNNTRNKYI